MPYPTYLSLIYLKSNLGLQVSTYDDQLNDMLAGIESSIELYIGFAPTSQQVTEFYDGNATDILVLGRKPFVSIANVWEQWNGFYGEPADSFPTARLLTQGTDYAVDTNQGGTAGILRRIDTAWPFQWDRAANRLASAIGPCLGCIKVQYTAGYGTAAMADIANAGLFEAAARWNSRQTGMGVLQSSSLDGRSVTLAAHQLSLGNFRPNFISVAAETTLRKYRKVFIGSL